MYTTKKIDSEHKDIIHDIAHDFYGKRMATCSSDHYVKVWDYKEDGEWHCSASFKAHSGSVWRVHWAHPEYGQVIATCSFDRTVAVWEEIVSNIGTGDKQQTHWNKRTSLVDSRTSVTDVKFAPKHLGLQLATVSADGVVRIYEAPDIMNLSQWSLVHNIICKMSCSCLSWNPSVARFHPPMLAIGSDDNSQTACVKVFIYEFNDSSRQWLKVQSIAEITEPVNDIMFAPNMGRSYHLLAVASKDLRILTMKPQKKETIAVSKYEIRQIAVFDEHKPCVWRVTWNVTGTVLASAGDDGVIRLWKGNCMDNWRCIKMYSSDGSSSSSESEVSIPLLAPAGIMTPSRYYKMPTLNNRNNWPGIS